MYREDTYKNFRQMGKFGRKSLENVEEEDDSQQIIMSAMD